MKIIPFAKKIEVKICNIIYNQEGVLNLIGRGLMKNYEHEIIDIRDRYLKNFIFYDYFHDSIITNISFLEEGKLLRLDLSCEREWPEHDSEKYIFDTKYVYRLYFKHCKYFEYERKDTGTIAEYLNGRFKNSAKLSEIREGSRNYYYHLRIQLADGYIDIIFNAFYMEKVEGEVKLPGRINLEWYFDKIRKRFKNSKNEDVRKMVFSEDWLDKIQAMEYLWLIKDEKCFDYAMTALDDEDGWIASTYILGELGRIESLKKLNNLLEKVENCPISKRHIKDTIEKILFKNRK